MGGEDFSALDSRVSLPIFLSLVYLLGGYKMHR